MREVPPAAIGEEGLRLWFDDLSAAINESLLCLGVFPPFNKHGTFEIIMLWVEAGQNHERVACRDYMPYLAFDRGWFASFVPSRFFCGRFRVLDYIS